MLDVGQLLREKSKEVEKNIGLFFLKCIASVLILYRLILIFALFSCCDAYRISLLNILFYIYIYIYIYIYVVYLVKRHCDRMRAQMFRFVGFGSNFLLSYIYIFNDVPHYGVVGFGKLTMVIFQPAVS
jgi:hypothetical protein